MRSYLPSPVLWCPLLGLPYVAGIIDKRETKNAILLLQNVDGTGVLTNAPEIIGWKSHDAKQDKPDDKSVANKNNSLVVVLCGNPLHSMDCTPAYSLHGVTTGSAESSWCVEPGIDKFGPARASFLDRQACPFNFAIVDIQEGRFWHN